MLVFDSEQRRQSLWIFPIMELTRLCARAFCACSLASCSRSHDQILKWGTKKVI